MCAPRFDLSNTLIHFVREINLDEEYIEMLPDEFGFKELVEKTRLSPFFLLRRILRKRQILSTWAVRQNRRGEYIRGVYGTFPAVCFTEMPIAAFVETSLVRQQCGEYISPYAIVLPKESLFNRGARPVIYGTSCRVDVGLDTGGHRILSPALFDSCELYRYVTYIPSGTGPRIDWSHEREWRWPNYDYQEMPSFHEGDIDDEEAFRLLELQRNSRLPFHGMNLDTNPPIRDIGFIVRTESQKEKILQDILWLVDTQRILNTMYTYILKVPELQEVQNLERPEVVAQVERENVINLEPYFELDQQILGHVRNVLDSIGERLNQEPAGFPDNTSPGISFPCLANNSSLLCRALFNLERIQINRHGFYLIDIPECNQVEGMDRQEYRAQIAAEILHQEFGDETSYYSVMGDSADVDGTPYYTSLYNDFFTNYAHDEEDY